MGYIFDFFMEEEWSLVVVKLVILRETKRGRPNKTFQANFSGTYIQITRPTILYIKEKLKNMP